MEDWIKLLLLEEAISNYIVGIIALIAGVIGWIVSRIANRKSPCIVRIEKLFEESLIIVAPELQDTLKITYEDQLINELHMATFEVYNTGTEPLKDVQLQFIFSDPVPPSFLKIAIEDPSVTNQLEAFMSPEFSEDVKGFGVEIPFLNPYKEHTHFVTFYLYSPKQIKLDNVTGSGFGWSTKYLDKSAYRQKIITAMIERSSPIVVQIVKILDIFAR